jgi:hypothetical protein
LNPPSTGLNVHANLTTISGASNQLFYDDATHGDVTAGDGVFSFAISLPSSQSVGSATIPFTVADAQARSGSGNINFTVNGYTWSEQLDNGADAGELPGAYAVPVGSGALGAIAGSLGASDADMYLITICDPSSFTATSPGPSFDSPLFLVTPDGTGLAFSDDNPAPMSTISNAFVPGPGNYILAISGYDRDPVNGLGEIWVDTPYGVERAPDGPGSGGGPVTGWTGTGVAAGSYRITLTGACFPSLCGTPDFNCDGDIGTDADIEAFFRCLAGFCPAAPCPNNADFNADGDIGTDADIESFFRVLAGNPC